MGTKFSDPQNIVKTTTFYSNVISSALTLPIFLKIPNPKKPNLSSAVEALIASSKASFTASFGIKFFKTALMKFWKRLASVP